ncbi:MAG: PEP-CTERM sorting domain-containing protein, partial [Candidatus Thiodiazotropha sp.]
LGAMLTLTFADISNSFQNFYADSYIGNGVAETSDFSLGGSFIGGRPIATDTPAGTVLSFSALPGDNLDILQSAVDTGSFFGVRTRANLGNSFVNFHSLESTVSGITPPTLTVEFAPVPVPAALPLFVSALGMFGLFNWRRRKG